MRYRLRQAGALSGDEHGPAWSAILAGDTGAISALRILHLYMERLGCDFQVWTPSSSVILQSLD